MGETPGDRSDRARIERRRRGPALVGLALAMLLGATGSAVAATAASDPLRSRAPADAPGLPEPERAGEELFDGGRARRPPSEVSGSWLALRRDLAAFAKAHVSPAPARARDRAPVPAPDVAATASAGRKRSEFRERLTRGGFGLLAGVLIGIGLAPLLGPAAIFVAAAIAAPLAALAPAPSPSGPSSGDSSAAAPGKPEKAALTR